MFQRHGVQGDADESFNTDGEGGRIVAGGGEYHPEDDDQDERDLVLLGKGGSMLKVRKKMSGLDVELERRRDD